MYFDNSINNIPPQQPTVQSQQQKQQNSNNNTNRSFVYIQYPPQQPQQSNNHYVNHTPSNMMNGQIRYNRERDLTNSPPTTHTSSSSSTASSASYQQRELYNYIDINQQRQQQQQQLQTLPSQPRQQTDPQVADQRQEQPPQNEGEGGEEQPKKKKRQHIGYACDKCRERRVGCDRGKPICGQCKDRYTCQYSNHALRLDNVSMRQRLDELENQVGYLTSKITYLEQDYRTTVPRLTVSASASTSTPAAITYGPATVEEAHVQITDSRIVTQQQQKQQQGPSVVDWAINTGWLVVEHNDQEKTIFTTIKKFEDLSEALKNTVQMIYQNDVPMYRHLGHLSGNSSNTTQGQHTDAVKFGSTTLRRLSHNVTATKEHAFTLFESLNRYSKGTSKHQPPTKGEDRYLETDVMTRLIHQHHKCGFPTLVSPTRFENHYRQGQLKPLVLSSVFSHSVPHACIYHPHLTQIQDFRELGNKFYNHSHDLLGIDEPANLSNIHQRTLLIMYDLDLGRVRRAFLHIGIAIRMCFMLNLHKPEGYVSCKSAFEREQSKRIFWTVWFYDNMVTQLFHDQLSTIKLDQIKIELPTPLPEFNRIEMDQTMFSISLIQIRKIAGSISEEFPSASSSSNTTELRKLVDGFRVKLWQFYHNLPSHLQFGSKNAILPPDISIWSRRNYFCILLDYCQCWITLYRALLPPAGKVEELTKDEQEAILHTSQAAVAISQLFQNWFQSSVQSDEGGFDCFFRPYLYHFMSAKNVFAANVSQQGGKSPALIYMSRAYLMLLLQLYQTTPTKRSFDESQLEKDMTQFLSAHQIGTNEIPYQQLIDEALLDDPNADGGWSIFSGDLKKGRGKNGYKGGSNDDMASRCSSNSSMTSDQPLPFAKSMELDLDYF